MYVVQSTSCDTRSSFGHDTLLRAAYLTAGDFNTKYDTNEFR